jgi:hypothetical protein
MQDSHITHNGHRLSDMLRQPLDSFYPLRARLLIVAGERNKQFGLRFRIFHGMPNYYVDDLTDAIYHICTDLSPPITPDIHQIAPDL